jgi:hypothetical protein
MYDGARARVVAIAIDDATITIATVPNGHMSLSMVA